LPMTRGRSEPTNSPRFLTAFAALGASVGAFFYASFFVNFASTLSNWSGLGFMASLQLFFNLFHGRPYQSSILATDLAGVSVGFRHNPYAFINHTAIHVNFTPYLFAPLWAFHPTPAFLYVVLFAWNLLGMGLFTRLIIRRLSPEASGQKILFALGVLAAGGLMPIAAQMAQFLLFAGPLLMAAYYFMLAQKRWAFLAALAALCLVSEDAAMVAVAFLFYLYVFEPKGKSYAASGACFALPYLLAALFWMQPAARVGLQLSEGSTATHVAKELFHLDFTALAVNVKSMLPVFTLFPAFVLAGSLFGWPNKKEAVRLAALAVLPALPHWGECVVVGGAHHLLPPFCMTYLALLRMVGDARPEKARRAGAAALAAAAVFFAVSLRALAGYLPNRLRLPIYRLAGERAKADSLEKYLNGGEISNRAVIAAALSLPPERSMVYLTNAQVPGFFLNRTDIWQFPDYFDLADDLLIQKDASDLAYSFDPTAPDLRSALNLDPLRFARNSPMTPEMLGRIKETLIVRERTHRILVDDEHVLILERLQPHPFPSPASTIGFGWMHRR
jgi:hypothetical protein